MRRFKSRRQTQRFLSSHAAAFPSLRLCRNTSTTSSAISPAFQSPDPRWRSYGVVGRKAYDLIKKLDRGANFARLAQEHSTGPSGVTGGDLGWFSAQAMVKAFSDAVAAMEDGAFSSEPVQTQFGWHIILREASRDELHHVRDKHEWVLGGGRSITFHFSGDGWAHLTYVDSKLGEVLERKQILRAVHDDAF